MHLMWPPPLFHQPHIHHTCASFPPCHPLRAFDVAISLQLVTRKCPFSLAPNPQHAFDVATGLSSDDDVDMGEAAGAGPSGGQGSHGANGAVAAGDAADGHVAAAAPGQQPAVGGAGKGGGRGGGGGQGAGAGVLLASRDLVGEALAKKQRRQKRKKQKGKAKAAAAVATGGRGAGGGAAD